MIKNPYKLAQKIKISGITDDGKLVIQNAFIFLSTVGIPFDIVVEELYNNNFIIDWFDFCISAKNDGWNKNTLTNKIKNGIDVFDDNYKIELMERINLIVENMYE